MNARQSFATIEPIPDVRGGTWKRLRLGETDRRLVLASDLPIRTNSSALEVVDLSATTVSGAYSITPKQPPVVTTEELGPGVILQVEPKCGPVSLVWLLLLASELEVDRLDQQVLYGIEANATILDLLVGRLLEALTDIQRLGWLGNDHELTIQSDSLEGELLPVDSVLESATRGMLLLVQRVNQYSYDIPINRVIATTLDFVSAQARSLLTPVRSRLIETLAGLPPITLFRDAAEAASVCLDTLESNLIPSTREYYTPVMQLCRLLLERFAISQSGNPELEYPPLRLPMASLFEKMARNIIARALSPHYIVRSAADDIQLGGRHVLYNSASPQSFNARLLPDIVVRHAHGVGKVAAILDAKYKDTPSSEDHYQLNAYMNAYDAPVGGFIALGQPERSVHRAHTVDAKTVYSFGFDLTDILGERERLASWIAELLPA